MVLILIVLFILAMAGIVWGYWLDYKNHKLAFIRTLFGVLVYMACAMAILLLMSHIINFFIT